MGLYYQQRPQHREQQQQQPMSSQTLKAAAAATAVGSMLLMSCLTFTGTVIALTAATPLLVIFSRVLVPAAIGLVLLTAGGFGIATLSVSCWVYRHLTKKHQARAKETDSARARIVSKAHDLNNSEQQRVDQTTS